MQAQQVLSQPPLPAPRKPLWMTEDSDEPPEMDMRPIHMFVHGQHIVPLAGNLGLGGGAIVRWIIAVVGAMLLIWILKLLNIFK